MHASVILVGGLGAFATQALAIGGIETVVDTTVITITSCGPEVESCPGKTTASATTSELTETSTYCPPTVATTAPAVVVPETPTATAIVPPPTQPGYGAPTINASSVTVQVSEVPSATSATSVAPVNTPASKLSSAAVSQSTGTEVPAVPTSAPNGQPSYSNSTMTAPVLSGSETGILTATGSPSTLTSVTVVPASSTNAESPSSSRSEAPKATGSAGRLVVPGIMLGLLAVGAAILG